MRFRAGVSGLERGFFASIGLLAAGCSSGASMESNASPSAELPARRAALIVLVDASAGDDVMGGTWTTPSCGDGCDPNCVDDGRYRTLANLVADSAQSLEWQRDPGPQLTLPDAARYCESLGVSLDSGESPWRLPTYDELAGIVCKAGGLQAGRAGWCSPAIDQAAFPATPPSYYWTAPAPSSAADSQLTSAAIHFFDGRAHRLASEDLARVRCVRDGAP